MIRFVVFQLFTTLISGISREHPSHKRLEMTENADLLAAAIAITDEASKVVMSHFRSQLAVELKADESPVTAADTATELAIRESLNLRFPGDTIFGEEFGLRGEDTDFWIIDPIDGTRSFIAGFPLFGMLLGRVSEGKAQLGVIRMPALGEVYAGAQGVGASCNGTPIRVSTCRELSKARLFINEADKLARDVPAVFRRLIQAGGQRRMAADCYPHALVAAGYADAVVDYDLHPYDYLPVSAVVNAAGGLMTDWQGQALGMGSDGRVISAATPALHAQLLELLNHG
jgi:histidinol phosphatase-like enzyme (inositol monophosphatase family)